MSQQLTPQRGFAPLRVQQQFRRLDDGRGARAAALAESLGVALQALPAVAESEGRKAFESGMKARIDGVKRENASAANKSLLGFMFSERAQDGFDYQDAQLDIPVIQSEELLNMEAKLRESRNPEDFRAYIAERDKAIQEKFKDRSDMYRYSVAEALQKTRKDQAKIFTSWVQNNRESDRRRAAEMAAKAKATQRAMELEEAGSKAFEMAQGGNPEWFSEFVKEASERYGLTPAEAKEVGLSQAVAMADLQNNPDILKDINPAFLSSGQRKGLADAMDTLTEEQIRYSNIQASALEADIKTQAEQEKRKATEFVTGINLKVASNELSIQDATAEILNNPWFQANPEAQDKALNRINTINTRMTDTATEQVALQYFEDSVVSSTLQGDDESFMAAVDEVLASTRSQAARTRVGELVANRDRIARDAVLKDLDSYYKDITQSFPSGVGQEQTLLGELTGDSGNANYFEAGADTQVRSLFEHHVLSFALDWYAENPDARMPHGIKLQIADQAYERAVTEGKRMFGQQSDTSGQGAGPGSALERLKSRTKSE